MEDFSRHCSVHKSVRYRMLEVRMTYRQPRSLGGQIRSPITVGVIGRSKGLTFFSVEEADLLLLRLSGNDAEDEDDIDASNFARTSPDSNKI